MKADNFVFTLIDDDEFTHYVVETLIKTELPSATVMHFKSAMEFLKSGDQGFEADVILLDINMPKITGWELLDQLGDRTFNVPIYMFSSSADSRDLQRMNNYPIVTGYIVKPLTIDKIRNVVADCKDQLTDAGD